MRKCDPIGLAKAVLWEEAKGKLRAIVAAEGSNIGEEYRPDRRFKFQAIEEFVDKFISEFEGEGYHE